MAHMQQHIHVGVLSGLATVSVVVILGFTSKWLVSKRPNSPAAQGLVALL